MKFYIIYVFLLLTKYIKLDCIDIESPNKASECILSSKEKEIYKYCCFEKIIESSNVNLTSCFPYDESDKKLREKEINGSQNIDFVCHSSSKLNSFIIFIILLLF